eukprot:644796_1
MKSYNRNNTRRNSRKAIKLCMNNIRKITDESHSRSNKAQRTWTQGNIIEQICGQNAARITIKVAYSNCKRQHKNRLKLINNTEQENIVIMHLFQWYSSRLYHVTSVFSNLCKDTQYECKDDN